MRIDTEINTDVVDGKEWYECKIEIHIQGFQKISGREADAILSVANLLNNVEKDEDVCRQTAEGIYKGAQESAKWLGVDAA